MPFTLVGALLRDFVFGEVFCKLIPFLQGINIFNSLSRDLLKCFGDLLRDWNF